MNVSNATIRRRLTMGLAVLAAAVSGIAWAANPDSVAAAQAPVVVAQAADGSARTSATVQADTFPAHERGVRAAAAQSPDALRRYVNRTRMIYGFYYNDFAPKE